MKRKFLSILLTLAMALTLLPVSAMAEGEEGTAAPTGETVTEAAETTLPEAVDGVITLGNGNYVMSDNTTAIVKVPTGVTATLDLGGKTLTNTAGKHTIIVENGARLTITGNGTVDNVSHQKAAVKNECGGTVVIDNGTFCRSAEASTSADNSGDNSYYVIDNQGTMNITGGTFKFSDTNKGAFSSLIHNGWYDGTKNTAKENATMIIADGEFTQGTGGKITVKNDDYGDLTINGGTFSQPQENYYCVYNANVAKITGGTIKGYVGNIESNSSGYNKGEFTITGGAFTDLANAVKYAADNATIKLAGDVSGQVVIPAGKTITLDLNGKTMQNDKTTIINNGKLTVCDSSANKSGKIVSTGNVGIGIGDKANNAVTTIQYANIEAVEGAVITSKATGAKITIEDGVFTVSDNAVIAGNGSKREGEANEITINGGIFNGGIKTEGYVACGIYAPWKDNITVNGGTFNITGGAGIVARAGNVTVTSGKFITTGDATGKVGDSRVVVPCAALVFDSEAGYPGMSDDSKISVTGGNFKSDVDAVKVIQKEADSNKRIAISGGLFSSDPSTYVPDTHHVEDSGNGSYPFAVKVGSKTDATIIVTAETNATVSDTIKTEDKTKIEAVKNKAKVEGMPAAIRDDKKADIAKAAGVTDNELAGKNVIETEITVKVEAKAADLAKGKLTFEASPEATVKVNGTVKGTAPVTNSMLNGQPITVKLPLPTVGGQLFNPKQILHKFTGGGYEYFINKDEGSKRGAGSFEIENGCAVFTIYGFSTFELSGTVTYVEPSSGGGSSSSSRRYDVSAPSVKHGDVTVSPKNASKGDTVTITVKPDSGYELDTLTVKDASGSKIKVKDKGDGKFTFTMPASKVTVSAEFAEIETLDFADVSTDAYYYEAVKWAAKKGITGGTGDGTFNPNGSCTRAHIVTFLWRAAGSPEPKSTVSFADVPAGSYYAKAVAWAVENGITLGTGDGTFSPNATCTRAQSVTFLYRAQGTAPTTVNGFTDVTADAFYADAVAWAVESGVTNGTSASTFSPNNGCTRAQIVTFLYRTMK